MPINAKEDKRKLRSMEGNTGMYHYSGKAKQYSIKTDDSLLTVHGTGTDKYNVFVFGRCFTLFLMPVYLNTAAFSVL